MDVKMRGVIVKQNRINAPPARRATSTRGMTKRYR